MIQKNLKMTSNSSENGLGREKIVSEENLSFFMERLLLSKQMIMWQVQTSQEEEQGNST